MPDKMVKKGFGSGDNAAALPGQYPPAKGNWRFMTFLDGSVTLGQMALLVLCLLIALGFEFVNGFHDTANAVATVIYTKSLRPTVAVVWSGFMNLLGVLFGGTTVAFGIVHLLPVTLLMDVGQGTGVLMVLSLLLSAIIWNLGTWYFGLPSSSSHALIGSILGVGLASSLFSEQGFGSGVNWSKAQQTGLALIISPLIGFPVAGGLLLIARAVLRAPRFANLFREPDGETPPPFWIRAILIGTCTGVSAAHGSNDGQKGIGLIMLILIGLLPAQFALNPQVRADKTPAIVQKLDAAELVVRRGGSAAQGDDAVTVARKWLTEDPDPAQVSVDERRAYRSAILAADEQMSKFEKANPNLSKADAQAIKDARTAVGGMADFVVPWVVYAVALSLGLGTMIGWKRIVVTVGEKIGKTHLTYAQGAAAEMVAMTTIIAADHLGLPVSTTHVLSSGIAGTMAANRSGLQTGTLRNIALAWVLTLPVTMLMSGLLFALTAGPTLKKTQPPVPPRHDLRRVPLEAAYPPFGMPRPKV